MSTQEEQKIIIDHYKFKNFCSDGNSVLFNVECIDRDADKDDNIRSRGSNESRPLRFSGHG